MNQERTITKLLGRNIRRLRREKGWSQMLLAAESGLDKSFVGGIERGEFNPSVRKVAMIADALQINVMELFRARPVKYESDLDYKVAERASRRDPEQS